MERVRDDSLAGWVMDHAAAGQQKLYFTINGDIPLTNSEGHTILIEIPYRGKRVCALHPDHLTKVAQICYENDIQMVQVMI